MYLPTHPVLISEIGEDTRARSLYESWVSNGKYLRSPEGMRFGRISNKEKRIAYALEVDQKKYGGYITDKLLISRIDEYMGFYYSKKLTNCASLANFLTTGIFVECSREDRYLVLKQGLRVYQGQKIGVGDMLCIMYADHRRMRSRRNGWRPPYMRSQKKRHLDKRFSHALRPRQKTFTPEEVKYFYEDARVSDFHFMVCVAHYNDEPVWISQHGWYMPGEEEYPYVVLTIGEKECYEEKVPLFTLIKKRR